MQKFVLVLAATVLAGCIRPEPEVRSTASRVPNADAPNVRVTVSAARGVDNINIKRGGESALNYAFGTDERHTVTIKVSDEQYLELRDLALAVLRDAPSTVDGGTVVNVSLLLLDDQLAPYGLKASRSTFSHHPGENKYVDALLTRVTALLDKHRVDDGSK